MSPLAEQVAPLAARLGRLRGAIRALFALDGLSRLVLAAAAFVAVTFAIDWTLLLPAEVRLVMLAGGLALAGWILLRKVLRPLGVRVSDDDLAVFVERHYPELNDRLISAIQLSREAGRPDGGRGPRLDVCNSPELVQVLVDDASKAASEVDFGRVIVRRHVGRVAFWAALAAAVLGGGALLSPVHASIYFNRILGGAVKWPQRTHLRVLDFEQRRRVVARGDDTTVAVEYSGVEPSRVVLDYEFRTGERGRERMSPLQGKRFQYTFTRVSGPFEFTVSGGDDRTEVHTVETLNPPSVESVAVFYEYPPYMRMASTPPDRPETSGNVVAPFHTKVRFEAVSNEDLKSASASLGVRGKERKIDLQVGPAAGERPRLVSGSFEVAEAYSEYSLHLVGANGLPNRDPVRFTVKGIEDRLPDVAVQDPLGDEFVTELCERPLEIEVKDDYGIARIALERRALAQQPEKARDWEAVEFTREQNSRDYGEALIRSRHVLSVASMGLQPGDHVEFRFRAEDYKDIGSPNVRTTRTYKLSVVALGVLEKELQDAIEKIKQVLRGQKIRQETAWNRTASLINRYGSLDRLSQEQQGEVRQAGLEQNDITSRLDTARRDIRQVMRRGVYNKIYNESAAAKLQGAIDTLELLAGSPDDVTNAGISREAAAGLDQSARIRGGAARTAALREVQGRQNAVATGIQRAIDFLDKWSSYQEVIRITREILEMQKRLNERIRSGK